MHKVGRAVAQQRAVALGQHLLLHHQRRVRIALGQEGAHPAAVGDGGPVEGGSPSSTRIWRPAGRAQLTARTVR